jgi:NTP pyrophosphatase (non-canonical NTP hydrolase)
MMDESTTLAELRRRVVEFNTARDWEQFHTPKNVSAAIAIEAAELMEHFLWLTDEQVETALKDGQERAAVIDEMADVLLYTLVLANALDADVSKAVLGKLDRNEDRFPVDEWRGRA